MHTTFFHTHTHHTKQNTAESVVAREDPHTKKKIFETHYLRARTEQKPRVKKSKKTRKERER